MSRVLSCAAWLGVATVVWAQPPRTAPAAEPSITVRFADLNTSTREGNRILYGRIRSAAQNVCGPASSLWDPKRSWDFKECYRATLNRAVDRLNLPLLTALHQQAMRPQNPAKANLQAGNR
jgi:UrcA family protein